MDILLSKTDQNTNKIRFKVHRSPLAISRKVIAFQELINLNSNKKTAREAAHILEVPNSTMQSWEAKRSKYQSNEAACFFGTPCGAAYLKKIVLAAHEMTHFGSGGIRTLQQFLRHSELDQFVASSEGALQQFAVRFEEQIITFGSTQEAKLSKMMQVKKITAGLDELYRGKRPCLVAIEAVSGFILLEKFTEDRTAETWAKELTPRLETLNVELVQVVSDLCGGIRSYAKEAAAEHSPDLFHAQHEITKATAAPLASQERAFATDLDKAEEKLKKIEEKYGMNSEKAGEAKIIRNCKQIGLATRKRRLETVRKAKKELGRLDHPIDLKTGKLQTKEELEKGFKTQLDLIEDTVKEAELSRSAIKRIGKARRAFDGILNFFSIFLIFYKAFTESLKLEKEQKTFFDEVIFPLSYVKMIWGRLHKEEREELKPLKLSLQARLQGESYPEALKKQWMANGQECAERFQRSSSFVEGQNGMLSLLHHRLHRLNDRTIKAVVVYQNFQVRRKDGTTAAERFFRTEHENLFNFLTETVRIPGPPQKQNHNEDRRALAWEKRRAV